MMPNTDWYFVMIIQCNQDIEWRYLGRCCGDLTYVNACSKMPPPMRVSDSP
jgi:hypothetical protein